MNTGLILETLATYVLIEDSLGNKPNYSDEELFNITVIMVSVICDKIYDLTKLEGLESEDACKMAESFGKEMHTMIKKYTGVDMHELTEKLINK